MQLVIKILIIFALVTAFFRIGLDYKTTKKEQVLNKEVASWTYDPFFKSYGTVTVLFECRDSGCYVTGAGREAGF